MDLFPPPPTLSCITLSHSVCMRPNGGHWNKLKLFLHGSIRHLIMCLMACNSFLLSCLSAKECKTKCNLKLSSNANTGKCDAKGNGKRNINSRFTFSYSCSYRKGQQSWFVVFSCPLMQPGGWAADGGSCGREEPHGRWSQQSWGWGFPASSLPLKQPSVAYTLVHLPAVSAAQGAGLCADKKTLN